MIKQILKRALLGAAVFSSVSFGFVSVAHAEEDVFQLCPILSDSKTYVKNKDFNQMVAGKDGWIYRTSYDLKQDDFALSEWSVTSFKRLRDAFHSHGTELAVSMIPTRGIVGYPNLLPPFNTEYDVNKAKEGYAGMLDQLMTTGIIVADTRDVDTVSGFFLKRDNHWTAIGAEYMAKRMADAIKAHPIYANLKKAEFITTSVPAEEGKQANDNFIEFIEENCKNAPKPEIIPTIFTTSRKQDGDVAQALLEDVAGKPEVVLLGTSNSTEPEPSYANYIGFLRENLSADVENQSVQGGSMRGAISNYVLTGDYEKSRPKLIIWELSAHYGLDQKAAFRELIPSVYGECSDKDALFKSAGTLNANETSLFKDLANPDLFSNAYYLYLELENKDLREVNVNFIHTGNRIDKNELERSLRNFPVNNGLFFSELSLGISQPLKGINVKIKDGSGAYKAKICKVPS